MVVKNLVIPVLKISVRQQFQKAIKQMVNPKHVFNNFVSS